MIQRSSGENNNKKHDRNTCGWDVFRISALVLAAVYSLSMIPVLMLGKYDFASADDYGFGAYAHVCWHQTGNVLRTIGKAFATAWDKFFSWQGTYSSIVIMGLEPGIWNANAYRVTVWIMVGMMTLSTLVFLHEVIVKIMGGRPAVWIAVSMLVLLMDVECMPDKTQGLYWFNGAAHYNIARCEALLFLALILCIIRKRYGIWRKITIGTRISTIVLEILACLLAFWLGGANLITALITELILICMITFTLVAKRRHGPEHYTDVQAANSVTKVIGKQGPGFDSRSVLFSLIPPFIFLSVGFALNILAPGNSVRADEVTATYGLIQSVFLACAYCLKAFLTEWSGWEWITFAALVLPFARKLAETVRREKKYTFRLPGLVIVLSFLFLAAMFAPTLYAEGDTGAGRLHDIIFMDGTLWLALDIFYVCGWIQQNSKKEHDVKRSRFWQLYIVAAALLTLLASALFTHLAVDRFTTTSAVHTMATGEAEAYAEEARLQIAIMEAYEGDYDGNVVIKEHSVHPAMIFNEDFMPRKAAAENLLAVRYYRFCSVRTYNPEEY